MPTLSFNWRKTGRKLNYQDRLILTGDYGFIAGTPTSPFIDPGSGAGAWLQDFTVDGLQEGSADLDVQWVDYTNPWGSSGMMFRFEFERVDTINDLLTVEIWDMRVTDGAVIKEVARPQRDTTYDPWVPSWVETEISDPDPYTTLFWRYELEDDLGQTDLSLLERAGPDFYSADFNTYPDPTPWPSFTIHELLGEPPPPPPPIGWSSGHRRVSNG